VLIVVAYPVAILFLFQPFDVLFTSLESLLKAKWQRIRPPAPPTISTHVYEIRPRADILGIDLICDVLPFGRLWYGEPNAVSAAIGYAKHRSRSHNAVIRVYDEAGKVIETHEHVGDFKESYDSFFSSQATILGFLDDPVEAARRFWIL